MLINNDLIVLDLQAKTKEEAIRLLGEKAKEVGRVSDVEDYTQTVLSREEHSSTGVGFGVAIPHGKTDSVTEPFLIFASVSPLDWNSLDGKETDLIFLIGVPEKDASTLHLQILSKISRNLMKEDFRSSLRSAKSSEEVLQILKDSEIGI